MKKMFKKTLSLFLALLMLMSVLPLNGIKLLNFGIKAHAAEKDTVAEGSCGADGSDIRWTLDKGGRLVVSGTGAMADYSYDELPQAPEEPATEPTDEPTTEAEEPTAEELTASDGLTTAEEETASDKFVETTDAQEETTAAPEDSTEEATAVPEAEETAAVSDDSVGEKTNVNAFAAKLRQRVQTAANGAESKNVNDGDALLTDEGATTETEPVKAPWFDYAFQITEIVIEEGVTHVGNYAFSYYPNVTRVTLPQGLKSVGDAAFVYVVKPEALVLPDGLETIGEGAFIGWSNVKELNLPKSVKTINTDAFTGWARIEKFTFPDSSVTLNGSPFALMTGVKELVIPADAAESEALTGLVSEAFALQKITNYSDTVAVSDSLEVFTSYKNAQILSVYYQCYFDSIPKYLYDKKFSMNDIIRDLIDKSETEFGYSYAEANALVNGSVSIGKGTPSYLTVYCNENSAEHEACRANGSKHYITGSDSPCVCNKFGTLGGNLIWTVNTETKTLTFSGSGAIDGYNVLPAYCSFAEDIKYVEFAEDSTVTSAGAYAFAGLYNLTSLTLPEGMTSIGDKCFYDSGINELHLPSTLTVSVDDCNSDAFTMGAAWDSEGLRKITAADGNPVLKVIDGGLYYTNGDNVILLKMPEYCYSGKYPSEITGVNKNAFESYRGTSTVVLPDVESFAAGSVISCSPSVQTVAIGSKTKDGIFKYASKDESIIYACDDFKRFYVSSDNPYYTAVDGVLCDKEMTKIIRCPAAKTSFAIPASVTEIGRTAFSGTMTENISLPKNVAVIGEDAFDSDEIKTITVFNKDCEINGSSRTLGTEKTVIRGFSGSTAEEYAKAQGQRTFEPTENSAVILSLDITKVQKRFLPYEQFNSEGLVVYADYADGTRRDVTDSVTFSGFDSTQGGTCRVTAEFNGMTASYDVTIEELGSVIAGGSCGADGGNVTWMFYESGTLVISGKGKMKSYKDKASFFRSPPWKKKNVISVVISEGVTSIGDYAFYDCSGLTSITITDGVTSIGDYAFAYCDSLTSITVPTGVISIGDYAFRYIPNVIYSGAAGGSPWGARAVNGYIENGIVYGDSSKKELLACHESKQGGLIIPDSVTSIGARAFYGCSGLTSIKIPDGVTSIGNSAFEYCSGLTSVTIPNGVTSIGDSAFRGCSGLTSITIPDGVTSIDDYAFYGCRELTSVTIPDSVTSIGNHAFSLCTGLTSTTIGKGVTNIGNNAFFGCNTLADIFIISKDCVIYDSATTLSTASVIHGYLGSSAQDYAKKYERSFVPFDDHEHVYSSTVTKEATCTQKGEILYQCTVNEFCKKSYTEEIQALGHVLMTGSDKTVVPTCVEKGFTEHRCVRCNEIYRDSYVDALGHEWAEELVRVEPTCTSAGYTRKDCVRCDLLNSFKWDEKYATDHPYGNRENKEYTFCYPGAESIELTFNAETQFERNYDFLYIYDGGGKLVGKYSDNELSSRKVIIEGNAFKLKFTSDGSVTRYGFEIESIKVNIPATMDAEYTVIPALGHDYAADWTVDKEPACTADGSQSHHCTRCDKKSDVTPIAALGHDYVSCDATEPTCTEPGKTAGVICKRCGETNIAAIPANGHTAETVPGRMPTTAETGLTDGKICSECGLVLVEQEIIPVIPEKLVGVNAVGDYERIIISWSKAAEAETNLYVVYRRADGEEGFSQLGTVSGRETLSYTDTSAEEDVNYSYYVTARNSYGFEGEPSDIASAVCAKDTEAPVVTKITPSANAFVSRTQKIKVGAVDNVAPVSAKLWYSVDDGESWVLIGEATSSPLTFDFDTAAIADGVILVKAVAYDKAGNESEPKTVKYAVDNTGPDKVTGLKAKVIYSSKITLEWNDVSSDDAASFILQRKTDGGFVNISSTVTTLGYNLGGLTPAASYTYRVAAVDNCGNVGEYSDELTVSTLADTSAPVVTKLAPAPARYSKYVNFSATASDDCDIKTIMIQYSFDRETWTDASSKTFTYASSSQTYGCTLSFADFDDGSVFVRAVATDSSGNVSDSSASAPFVEYYVDHTPPATPAGFTATGGDGYIYLKWNTGDEIDLGKYQLTRADSADGNYLTIASALTTVDFYDRNVTEGHTYYYKLRVADTANNDSEYTDWVSAQPLEDTVKPIVNSISPVSGSVVGPAARGIGVLASDNGMLGSLTVEYRTSADSVFKTLATVENIGSYYKNYTVNLPLDEMNDGDTVYVRARCTDTAGLESDYSDVYAYTVDKTAPAAADAAVKLEGDQCLITWKNDSSGDISGFKLYRITSNGFSTFIGSRGCRAGAEYSFYDYLSQIGGGEYTYRIDAFDRYGNCSQTTAGKVIYEAGDLNEAPTAIINGVSTMEVGVEEYFDGGKSIDDVAVTSYSWDFGDGTYSSGKRPVKKYTAVGIYTVTLTVFDAEGLSDVTSFTVTVRERTEIGTLEVTVVDENNRAVAYAPVYFDLGSDSCQTVYANASGVARLVLPHGEHLVGVYRSGYLPAQRRVTVIANTVRKTSLTVIKQEMVTGEFEVRRMTPNEITAAGIDVLSPANQNIYSVSVQITYGSSKIPVKYIRNDTSVLSYTVGDSNGGKIIKNDGGEERCISGISFVPNKQNKEIIAVVDIPVNASYLKEFFDVKLHIINNASSDFELVGNTVELNVPNGLTLMTGLSGNWCESSTAYIDSIKGLETKTLSWVLRGDAEGEYNLSADYTGMLDSFNETVSATFVTEDPIRVYGLSNVGIEVEVCDEIKYNAVYFNVGIKNIGSADVHNPQLDFDGIVSNITATVKAKAGEKEDGSADFDAEASLLNVKYINSDGKVQYIPFSWTDNGTVHVDIETLAPGESVSYEYAAYNLIDYDEIAYFGKAAKEVLSGCTENVSVVSRPFDLYNMNNASEKLENALSTVSDAGKLGQLDYDVSDVTYYPSFTSAVNGKTYTDGDLPFIYDDCFFNRKATDGVNNGLAAASANLAAAAYSDASTVKSMLEDMGYSVVIMKNYSASDIGAKTDYVAYTVSEKKVGETSVLVVSVRGTSSYDEWNSNFNIGKNGKYHEGFNNAANEVLISLSQYFEGAGLDKEHTKIWITGHSRGAAVANIVAEKLTKEAKYATADNIYAYTYACPNTSTSADTSLSNIYNYCDGDDLVASVPFASWGFKRAGKTFAFSMAGGAQTVFRSITGKAYSGSKACTEFADAVAEIASDANEYYSLGLNEIMGEVAKLLSDKSVDVGVIRNNLLKIAAGRPAQVINAVNKAIALFIDGSGIDSVCHAHCPETYISYVAAAYPTGQIVTAVKKSRGDTTPKFNVSKNNALEYILNDGNYLYVTNTDWIARISEQAFNTLKLATLDFEVLTKDKQKKLAQTVILQLLTDSTFNTDIDTLIDVQYLKTVKTVLGAIKSTVSLPDNTEFIKTVNAILSNRSTLNSLATALKMSGSEALSSELIKSFAGSITEAAAMQAIKIAIASNCSPDGLAAELLGEIGTLAGCTSSALDTLILKPAQLYNSVEYAEYVHGLMNFFTCSYEANLILDTLIGNGSKQLTQRITELCGYYGISPVLAIISKVDVAPAELVSGVAEEMKAMMTTEFNAELEALKQAASDLITDGAKKLLKTGIKELLGKANVWYLLFTSVFKIIDSGFGISDYFGDIDTYNIITYVSSVLATGYYARATAFENYSGMQDAMEKAEMNYSAQSTDRLAADALYLLKALCNTRLVGEKAYKAALEKNNSTWLMNDADHDYNIIKAANERFGTSCGDIETLYDYIYGNILSARDIIFNIENTSEIDRPAAPEVTVNYSTDSTDQAFDSTYEYCFSDGEWQRCTGGVIPVKVKTHPTVLRVRKASGNGNPAGEITTVTVYARRSLSKTVTARFDNGRYHFTNLSADRTYAFCPVSGEYAGFNDSERTVVSGGFGANAPGKQARYIAIKSLANDALFETESEILYVKVNIKHKLTVIREGNGSVAASASDFRWFIGDEAVLTASPSSGETFIGWYKDAELLGTGLTYAFDMYEAARITAKFSGDTMPESVRIIIADAEEPNYAGLKKAFRAEILPENTADKSVTWSTSDSSVASVAADGTVTFVSPGTAKITVTAVNGITDEVSVDVVEDKIIGIKIEVLPDKTEFTESETFNSDGMTVAVFRESGKTELHTDFVAEPFGFTAGKQTAKVTYAGFEDSYSFTVKHGTFTCETVAPTCVERGFTKFTCDACGFSYCDAFADALGHDRGEWVVTVSATCTEDGERCMKCTVCGTVLKTESVPAHGHADADKNGKCDNCGESLTSSCKHICHSKNSLAQFFWKMLRLMYKLFKNHEFCDCGVRHW